MHLMNWPILSNSCCGYGGLGLAGLHIPASWGDEVNGSIRGDIWEVLTDGTTVRTYPILGFSNYGGAARRRAWDGEIGWLDPVTSVSYDDWNTLAFEFTGGSFKFSVNGTSLDEATTIEATTGFSAVIMQAYN